MKENSTFKLNRHFIFIEDDENVVGKEAILWGESSWWPKKCAMKFIRTTGGELRVGTKFRQKVLIPFAPKWDVEITKFVPNREIERTFLNGMFKGRECVKTEARANGTRVDYVMEYEIQGLLNKILWPLIFRRLHDKNIKMILGALKVHLVKEENLGGDL